MNYYFIDYENVGEGGLDGIENVREEDVVLIFYSKNAGRLSFETHKLLCDLNAKIEYHNVNASTKNALDFQLASYLGYLMAKNGNRSFYIISKDNGFNSLISFWEGKNVLQQPTVSGNIATSVEDVVKPVKKITKVVAKKSVQNEDSNTLKDVLQVIDDREIAVAVTRLMANYKTKIGINNAIVKMYGTEKAGEIYKKIKPLLKDKKGQ